ncbi:MAG: glycosyltransferase family 2 protein [Bacilli bacterium]|nr:glycosyltransferase family 2 protein [Bacilli bacterium]
MKLATIVVFYYPSDDNIKNINTYLDEVEKVFVVDNSDDDVIRLKSTKKIEYIKFYENKGIAQALNEGAKRARDLNFKWLLTLDQDSKITKKNISALKEFIENTKEKRIGLVAPFQDIGLPHEKSDKEYEECLELMTSGSVINLEAYKKIGGFKDWLFIDCVDTDYCLNLLNHKYQVLRLNNVIMKHSLGDLTLHRFLGKTYDCFNHNPIRRYYIVRNNLYIYEMYHDLYPEYCDHLIRCQKGQVKRILVFEKDKFKKLKMMYKGYKDYKNGVKGRLSE